MCGSPKIFLMPPMSFGVKTRVARNYPLWSPTAMKQDPSNTFHHFHQILVPWFPQTWLWELPGVWSGKSPSDVFNEIMGSAGTAAMLTCALARAISCLRVSAVPPSARPWTGT